MGYESDGTVGEELENIKGWAAANNMVIHPTKTKELVVYRARRRSPIELANPLIEGAERVLSLRVLGDNLNSMLTMTDHIIETLKTAPRQHTPYVSCARMAYTLESCIWLRELPQ